MSGPTNGSVVCGCGRIMRVKKNSVTVEELLEDGRPYKLWDADLFECLECGVEVITGFGRGPIAEHFQPTYAEQRALLKSTSPIYPARCREADAPVSYPPLPAPLPPAPSPPPLPPAARTFEQTFAQVVERVTDLKAQLAELRARVDEHGRELAEWATSEDQPREDSNGRS